MPFARFYIGDKVDQQLRLLKGRTGLTPNLLCRIGFCLSLVEPGVPDPALYLDLAVKEINRITLTGQWDDLFFALLRERMVEDDLNPRDAPLLEAQFKAHINRGVQLLSVRARSLADVAQMAAAMQRPVSLPTDGEEAEEEESRNGAATTRLYGS